MIIGRKTRGKTRPQRLHALDAWVCEAEAELLKRQGGPWDEAAFVDVGYGEHPWTTLESAAMFRGLNPRLYVLGVEIEPHRVESAQEHADAQTAFELGGFELDALGPRPARLIRALNVLRQYRPQQVPEVHRLLGQRLLEGGLLLEGTCDKVGSVMVVHLLRRRQEGLHREAMLFYTDCSQGFAPIMFRDRLPRDLRRRVVKGEPIHDFFQTWMGLWSQARREAGELSAKEGFVAAAAALAQADVGVAQTPQWWQRGYVIWAPEGGVPKAE